MTFSVYAMKTIEEKQREFIAAYNRLDDELMQYEFLLQLAGETPLPKERTEEGRIRNCQTDSWVMMLAEHGKLFLSVDSESLLIRGVLGIYAYLLDGMPLCDVIRTPLYFMDAAMLDKQLDHDRFAVLSGLSDSIRGFCQQQ